MATMQDAWTVQDVWGFARIACVNTDVSDFTKAMDAAAKSRGIKPHVPSDALDASRDLILDEAAESLGAWCEIVGDELRVQPVGISIIWPEEAW